MTDVQVVSVVDMRRFREGERVVGSDDMARFKKVGRQAGELVASVCRMDDAPVSISGGDQRKTDLFGISVYLQDNDIFVAGRYSVAKVEV